MKRTDLLLLALLIIALPGCGTTRQDSSLSDSSIRYFSSPAGNPAFLIRQDMTAPHEEIFSGDKRDLIRLETRYFSVTLPDSADTAGLAWQLTNTVQWWKKFELAEELDALYEKVLQTTELYKSTPDKIRIDFRETLFFSKNGSTKPFSTPAAYSPERKTIYAIMKKVTREVMAHEMSHAALHLFTGMRLSRNVDEAVAIWTAEQLK